MEGKGVRSPISSVIMCVLILGLVVTQIQVEAASAACCKNKPARENLKVCISLAGGGLASLPTCIDRSSGKCIWQSGAKCPHNFPDRFPEAYTLQNSEVINEYCKLGCVSSVCSSISTFQNSADVDEEVVKAVEHCNNACSELCTKGSNIALVTAA